MNRIVTKWVAGAAVGLLCWSQGPRTGLAVALAQTAPAPAPSNPASAKPAATPAAAPATTPAAAAPAGAAAPQAPPAGTEAAPEAAPPAPPPVESAAPQPAPEAAIVETPAASTVLDTSESKKTAPIAIWISGGVSVAAFATGVALAIDATSKNSAYNDNPSSDLANSGESSAFAADIAFGI